MLQTEQVFIQRLRDITGTIANSICYPACFIYTIILYSIDSDLTHRYPKRIDKRTVESTGRCKFIFILQTDNSTLRGVV